jgi:hypothetical protein
VVTGRQQVVKVLVLCKKLGKIKIIFPSFLHNTSIIFNIRPYIERLKLINRFPNYILIFLFFTYSNFSFSQITVGIKNTDIEDVSAINIIAENNEVIKSVNFRTINKTLFIESARYEKLNFSHIGFYDTTIVIKSSKESHFILLRPKINELKEVVIRPLQSYIHTEKRERKKILLFPLSRDKIWYFLVNISKLEAKKIKELSIQLRDVDKNELVEVTLYETIKNVTNNDYLFKDTIRLSTVKNDNLKIVNDSNNNIALTDDFILGLRIISTAQPPSMKKNSVITRFQEEESQVYYQTENGIIHKIPNSRYFEYFNAYPSLLKRIQYEK